MAKVSVNGTITFPKSGSSKLVHLWELYDLPNGVEAKRRWTLWTQALPTDITEGTWIDVRGTFSMTVSKIDGVIQTYPDKNGNQITSHDISLNDVEIVEIKMKDNPVPAGVDLDDVRKYGKPGFHALDESPF
jgi:hypothetical protein